ncbi:hypothetical protein [Acidithiobacillus ferrianus]|jgi:hypothetical protein|uniref:hypothetical protein n=1 Tax=Acidithiobacillus ferrianus TaxID=2678518 RepID=UPI0034E5F363
MTTRSQRREEALRRLLATESAGTSRDRRFFSTLDHAKCVFTINIDQIKEEKVAPQTAILPLFW